MAEMTPGTDRKAYRTAIVGAGGIAGAHAKALRALGERAHVVAAVDVDLDRVTAFAGQWQVPRVYQSLRELLQAEEVDLVSICTPPRQHAELAAECLRAGATTIVEKPPALSLDELDELAAVERASAGNVAVIFQHRFGSGARRLRRMAAAGELGRPMLATCATQWYRDDEYFAVPWRGSWEDEGGGPTMGHGIHQFDLLLSVLGPWQEVTAMAARQARRTVTEDVSLALVSFTNGAMASVVNSVLSPRETSALRFDYERATVELEHVYGYSNADWRVTPAPGHEDVLPAWAADPADVPSGHPAQLAAILDALDRGEPPPVTLKEARDTMEFAAALYASAFTGERVARGEITPGGPFSLRMDGTGAPWLRVDAT